VKFSHTSALWLTLLFALVGADLQSPGAVTGSPPLVHSFYQDDQSCSEHAGEATQEMTWNGQTWDLTAPLSVISPPEEVARVGTPLDVRPLDVFVSQAKLRGGVEADPTVSSAGTRAIRLRLVRVVHSLVPVGPATYSLQSIIWVRLCETVGSALPSALYEGPRKGVTIKDWWMRRKSERWVNAYGDAFSLAVGDALDWAAAQTLALMPRDGKPAPP
jgi:hypothetical protein